MRLQLRKAEAGGGSRVGQHGLPSADSLWLCLWPPPSCLPPPMPSPQGRLHKCQATAPLLIILVPKTEQCLEPIQHKAKPMEISQRTLLSHGRSCFFTSLRLGKLKKTLLTPSLRKGAGVCRLPRSSWDEGSRRCFHILLLLCAGTYQ